MKRIYVAGSINMDLVIKTDTFPVKGMTVMGEGFMTNPGGKGANQAVAGKRSPPAVCLLWLSPFQASPSCPHTPWYPEHRLRSHKTGAYRP